MASHVHQSFGDNSIPSDHSQAENSNESSTGEYRAPDCQECPQLSSQIVSMHEQEQKHTEQIKDLTHSKYL